jgi:enoyl-CoA hydratase/carnithine racemase
MRFRIEGNTITFDDGGMNLLSSDALRELREVIFQWKTNAACPDDDMDRRGRLSSTLIFRMSRAAGADMAEMARFTPREAEEFARLGQETFAAIEQLPALTIACIDGDCFGGALDLILAFDLRYATERARFSHPGAKLGIVTGFGGTSRWRRVIESPAARRLFLANPILNAHEALDAGLIDGIGEPPIPGIDANTVRFVKELTMHRDRLTQRDLLLFAERLGALYNLYK